MIKGKRFKINYNGIVMLLGFFSTTPVITIPLGSRDIAVFRVFFYLILAYLLLLTLKKRTIIIGKHSRVFVLWLLESILACVCGWLFFMNSAPAFSNAAFSSLFKVFALLAFALVWINQEKEVLQESNKFLLYGLLFGCIANLIWATIDGIGFYLFRRSINNIVFSGYIHRHNVRYGMLSLIKNSGLIRAAGFNSDPAQIGFTAPVVFYYGIIKRKFWLVLLSILGIIASASTTALAVSLIILFIVFITHKSRPSIRITTKNIIIFVLVLVGIIIGALLFGNEIAGILGSAINKFAERVNTVYGETTVSNIRWDYIVLLPRAFINLGLMGILGLGFGTASYGYIIDQDILKRMGSNNNFAYDPENTYIAYFLDTGVIGFILFIIVMVTLLKSFSMIIKKEKTVTMVILYGALLATVLSMFFYHYILFTPQVFLMIIGLSFLDNQDTFVQSKNIGKNL